MSAMAARLSHLGMTLHVEARSRLGGRMRTRLVMGGRTIAAAGNPSWGHSGKPVSGKPGAVQYTPRGLCGERDCLTISPCSRGPDDMRRRPSGIAPCLGGNQ